MRASGSGTVDQHCAEACAGQRPGIRPETENCVIDRQDAAELWAWSTRAVWSTRVWSIKLATGVISEVAERASTRASLENCKYQKSLLLQANKERPWTKGFARLV